MEILLLANETQEGQDLALFLIRLFSIKGKGLVDCKFNKGNWLVNTVDSFDFDYGIHRLVRISPYDEQGRRHTSFVDVRIGDKIRNEVVWSYILDPITHATNHLTGWETEDVRGVLEGKYAS